MYELHRLLGGNFPTPLFSMRQGIWWTSFIGSPSDIPQDAIKYVNSLHFPTACTRDGRLEYMDYESYPVYLDPKKQYRSFNPAAALTVSALGENEKDLLAWLYSKEEIELLHHILDDFDSSGEIPHFMIDSEWREECVDLGSRVNEVCVALASKFEFYKVEDVPPAVDANDVGSTFVTKEDTYLAASDAQRALLDQLGLLTWFTTITWDWSVGIPEDMVQFVAELRLGERSKRRCLLSIHRDWKFMNVGHFMRNSIPFHYPWTEREEEDPRFFIYSLAFLNEYSREVKNRDGEPVPVEELPNYYTWRSKIMPVDMFLQDNMHTEGRSWRRPRFTPEHKYFLILHDGWGARRLYERPKIHACAELYNCVLKLFDRDAHVTFFAQYPFIMSLPRMPVQHRFDLWWFGRTASQSLTPEETYYTWDPILEREKWAVSLAPREDRVFNA
ncbi:hypothetical protein DFH09DRAFT_1347078 [Mycena vulgaris]|nr:hypothetical protein DFH09DRAFT_1347078 [Mycena vulgaris]